MTVVNLDCRLGLALYPDNSFDSIVTDPPYELGFMGKAWDSTGIANDVTIWREALRVLKPGGHLLAFGGSRTYHRMACAIEDAGFDVRDQIMWLYGSGFPKSHNGEWGGTALKPAHEPICMARKPLAGTVAANWAAWGTGALEIDGCRVETDENRDRAGSGGKGSGGVYGESVTYDSAGSPLGRWPANVIHDGSDEVLAAFPAAGGARGVVTGAEPSSSTGNTYEGTFNRRTTSEPRRETDKSAARFFYCAKASRADRNEGCDASPQKVGGMVSNTSGQHITRRDEGYEAKPLGNHHPTVKPVDLMRYLCRLVTPPGGLVLDLFAGSGSTGKAAKLEGFRFIGFELSAEYAAIANARIEAAK